MVILSRALVAILGFLSVVLAVLFPSMIVMIVAMSLSSFLMLIPLLVGALYWPRATKWGAIAGLVVGLAVLALTMFVYTRPFGISGVVPGVWALAASSIAFAIVSYATKPPPPEVISRFHGYLESAIYGGEGGP
jgi:SSS family solute:Na+ symporter